MARGVNTPPLDRLGQWPYKPGMKLTLIKAPDLQAFLTAIPVVDGILVTSKGRAQVTLDPFDGRMIVKDLVAIDRGAGRNAMEMICAAADRHGVTLVLFAVPLAIRGKKMPTSTLENFYSRFGFEQHGFRNGNGHAQMRRKPR
jgi:hypothetical protein